MKRLYIAGVLALAAGMFAGLIMRKDPGYVLFSWGQTTVEMSLWVALILILAMVVGFHILMRMLAGVRHPIRTLNLLSGDNRDKRALRSTVRGLLLLAEGQWRKAERLLDKSAGRSGTPLINYLAAARAAHAQGRNEQTDQLLQKALESTPSAETAVSISQAEIQYERGQYEQCLASLLRLQKKNPRHRWVLKTLMKVYRKLEDWQSLSELYPQLLKNNIVSDDEGKELLTSLHISMFKNTQEMDDDSRREAVQAIWKKTPGELKYNNKLAEAYARSLLACGAELVLERFLQDRLRKHWSDELVVIFGLISKGDNDHRLKQTQKWLEQYPESASLLLTAGRLSLRNQDWDKGADYLEQSFRKNPLATTAAELSRLYASMGNTAKSQEYYQYCLDLAGYNLPGLPMPEAVKA
ncbi:heme biosynthesis HemY N-terminal domain-containing protein [Oceanospirillum beijerinckii]|uniref:heme biosynthesis HemY N-terminal domain-containing protein n=1 Tax=Oceanospirillum beijerinckii TaxID=64976 RepID=UPI00040D9842|nr:heme biosynthesis HemY N-terminal domain-containing protein [Oceanospirillum beijerinckii]